MKKLRIKNTKLTIIFFGWLQLIGGISGLCLVCYLMIKTGDINGLLLFIFLLGLSLFVYSIYCGKILLTEPDKKMPLMLSITNQMLQIIQFQLFGFGLTYSSGILLSVGLEGQKFTFNFGVIVSNFAMAINSDSATFVKINLAAISIILIMLDILKEIKSEQKNIIIDSTTLSDAN